MNGEALYQPAQHFESPVAACCCHPKMLYRLAAFSPSLTKSGTYAPLEMSTKGVGMPSTNEEWSSRAHWNALTILERSFTRNTRLE
jgi:hypothetical protein